MCRHDPIDFKLQPPANVLTFGALSNRFLQTDLSPNSNDSIEYRLRPDAPCPIIDAHVQVAPQIMMDGIWSFYDKFYWPILYKKTYEHSQIEFLLKQGVSHVVLLIFAHKAGIARLLNQYMSEMVEDLNTRYGQQKSINGRIIIGRRRVATGLGTVMPGEPEAVEILTEAFTTLKLSGIKMHSHVQGIAANDPRMDEVYETCIKFNKPCLIHAGKQPAVSTKNEANINQLCDTKIIEDVLIRFPKLKLCIPHLGMHDHFDFFDMLGKYPNLYLDTSVAFSSYFLPLTGPNEYGIDLDKDEDMKSLLRRMLLLYSDRVLYGTDFPNIPTEWCRELANIVSVMDRDPLEPSHPLVQGVDEELYQKEKFRSPKGDEVLQNIFWRNSARFYGIEKSELGWWDEGHKEDRVVQASL